MPLSWQTCGEFEVEEITISHCSFRIAHYADPEEPLRRSEVLPIVAYMKWRMRLLAYDQRYISPTRYLFHEQTGGLLTSQAVPLLASYLHDQNQSSLFTRYLMLNFLHLCPFFDLKQVSCRRSMMGNNFTSPRANSMILRRISGKTVSFSHGGPIGYPAATPSPLSP
ncbi:hypothetical protein I7I48_12252 [Histoplasma ohiense]|nr:hypothetical protein I7I48_12252 [Histoplasma ohiense (nom. inval.)]